MKHTSISLLFVLLKCCHRFAGNQLPPCLSQYYLMLGLLGILGLGLALYIIVMYWQIGTEPKESGAEA
jgi:hypothetical protein